MIDGRKRATVLAAFALTIGGVGISLTAPASADPKQPDLKSAQAKADALYRQAEIASEKYNDAREAAATSQVRLKALNADLARQQGTVAQMRKQVATMVVDQYQGQALSTATQVVFSTNPDAFLDNLSAITSYNDQRGQVMGQFATQMQRLALRQKAVKAEQAELTALETTLGKQKSVIDEKAAAAEKELEKVKADARAKMMAGSYDGPIPDASGRAASAIKYAMSQVGKSYVFGAMGPSAFDCSGLTMRAWGTAGVGLPHSSRAQFSMGPRISEDQLQPGDLVFYYSPISHVGIYIGNGMIVNAQNPRAGVKVTGLHSMPYVGAVRPG